MEGYRNPKVLVPRKKLEYIAYNHITSHHFDEQFYKRNKKTENVRRLILESNLSWYNTDGNIVIAVSIDNCIIVRYSFKHKKYMLLTYKEKSQNGYNIIDKFIFAYRGVMYEKRTEG